MDYIIENASMERKIARCDCRIALVCEDDATRLELAHFLPLKRNSNFHQMANFTLFDLDGTVKKNNQMLDELRGHRQVRRGSHVFHETSEDEPVIPSRTIYIEFSESARRSDIHRIMRRHNLVIAEALDARSILARTTVGSCNPIKVSVKLRKLKSVRRCEPDFWGKTEHCSLNLPSDEFFAHQWHLRNTGMVAGNPLGLKQGVDVGIVNAWEHANSLGNSNVTLAVIDEGFDLHHLDLAAETLLRNPTEFTTVPRDIQHGTACAALALSRANAFGGVGCAPWAGFMPITIRLNNTGNQIRLAIDHAKNNRADVLSCSFRPSSSLNFFEPVRKAILDIVRTGRNGKGVPTFVAAGNKQFLGDTTPISTFANNDDVITVAACTSDGQHAPYSKTGQYVDICAPAGPSNDIFPGQLAHLLKVPQYGSRQSMIDWDGNTSGANAIAAGVGAFILSQRPDITAHQLKIALRESANRAVVGQRSDFDQNGHSDKFGYGLIDADAALQYLNG